MSAKKTTRWVMAAGLAGGLALAIGLIASQGFAAIGQAMLSVGWWGLLAMLAFRFAPLLFDTLGWQGVLGGDWRGRFRTLLLFRWIRDSVNLLLPVAQVGGDVAAARLLTFRGVPSNVAGASLMVDKTLEAVSQIVFAFIGCVLLVQAGISGAMVTAMAAGMGLAIAAVAALLGAQWLGLGRWIEIGAGRLMALFGKKGKGLSGLHDLALGYYRDPRRFLSGVWFHLLGWLSGAVDVWLVLWFMGLPIDFADAVIIESVGKLISSAAFMVPGSLGVQEAGYMMIGTVVGLPSETALAVSLVKRVRHIIAGLPALVVWQALEGRRWFAGAGQEGKAASD